MNKNQKARLRHAANAIAKGYVRGTVVLGGYTSVSTTEYTNGHERTHKGTPRLRPTAYLAQRAGGSPDVLGQAQSIAQTVYGLTAVQARKADDLASSTHSPKLRAIRVSNFLARVAKNADYVGTTALAEF